MATKVGDAFVEIGARTDKLNRGLKQSRGMMGGLGSMALRLGAVIGGALISRAVIRGLKNMVVEASDAQETFSKFGVVFQDVGVQAENAAQKLTKSFGLSSVHAKQLLGDTGDLLSGFGFAGKEALAMSTRVNELAVDLASFTNVEGGAARASRSLTKALLGERESVKELGIAILEKDVLARVAMNTAKGLTFETLRQAKANATLELAIEQSKNAIGDYARTSDSLANRMKRLSERSQDLRVVIGQGIADFFNISDAVAKFTTKVEGLTGALTALANNGMFARWAAEIKFTMTEVRLHMTLPFILAAELIAGTIAKLAGRVEWFGRVVKATFINAANTAVTVWQNMTDNLGGAMAQMHAEMTGQAWNLGDQVGKGLLDGLEAGAVEMPEAFTRAFKFDEIFKTLGEERKAAWAEFLAKQKAIDEKIVAENASAVDKQKEKEKELQEEKKKTIGISKSFADILTKAQEFAERSTDKGKAGPGAGVGALVPILQKIEKNTADFAVVGA